MGVFFMVLHFVVAAWLAFTGFSDLRWNGFTGWTAVGSLLVAGNVFMGFHYLAKVLA